MTGDEPQSGHPAPDARPVRVGDPVAFSTIYLNCTRQRGGRAARARGRVMALTAIGRDLTLADILWDTPGLPQRTNVKNIVTVHGDDHGG